MKYLCRMVGKTRRDDISIKIIRDQVQVSDLKTSLERQVKWFRHIWHMDELWKLARLARGLEVARESFTRYTWDA